MGQIAWSDRAIQDLKDIVEYISRDSKAYAQSFALQIREKIERLGSFPESGPQIPEDRSGSIRQIIVGNYRVLYRHFKADVFIVTVVHGARNIEPTA
jgi:addiction module RelE/StbE family toxin